MNRHGISIQIGLVCRAKCSQNASIGRQRIPILGGEVVGFANKWENITWNPVLFFYSVPELLNSCSLLWAWFRIRHQICSDGFLNVRSWKCHTFKSAVGIFLRRSTCPTCFARTHACNPYYSVISANIASLVYFGQNGERYLLLIFFRQASQKRKGGLQQIQKWWWWWSWLLMLMITMIRL